MKSTVAFVVLALGILPQGADAGPTFVVWSSNAAGCTVGDPAIQQNRYLITAGSVKHQSTNVDLITFYCPVNNVSGLRTNFRINRLWVTYRDSTGSDSSLTSVTASLIRMNLANGGIATIATFSSDAFPDTGDALNSVGFTHTWDWGSFAYYIRVDLKRDTPSDTVIFYAVALEQNHI